MPCLLDSYHQAPNVSDSSHFSKSRSIMTPYVNVLLIELVTFIVLFVIYIVLENVLIGDKYREETEKEKNMLHFPWLMMSIVYTEVGILLLYGCLQ